MDAERKRIEEDLRGQLAGDVRCDDLFVQLYASDASIYEIRPLGVIRPRSVNDVVATVRYAAANGIPLHPRGSGSSLSGGSLGRGLIVDFSRYFRRIVDTGEDSVRVQAGVVLEHLNTHLAKSGRLFGPDPETAHVTTMGGVISVDASGSRWPRYGSARRHVESLEVVLATGEVARLHRHGVPTSAGSENGKTTKDAQPGESPGADPTAPFVAGLDAILKQHDQTIRENRSRSSISRSGYQLHDLRDGSEINLARLIAGSEGTLAIVTEATLSTDPLPSHIGRVLLFFDSLEKAVLGAIDLRPQNPAACDLMDRRHLILARRERPLATIC